LGRESSPILKDQFQESLTAEFYGLGGSRRPSTTPQTKDLMEAKRRIPLKPSPFASLMVYQHSDKRVTSWITFDHIRPQTFTYCQKDSFMVKWFSGKC
jgi:hypothetical protein